MAHPGGRPPLYTTEKELCDDIENNIARFCHDALDTEYISHIREKYLSYRRFGSNKPHVDFEIVTDKGKFIVECKNPHNTYSEMTRSISQLLSYGTLAEPDQSYLVLVTTATLPVVQQTIYKYELPILVVYMADVIATWDIATENSIRSGDSQVRRYAIS